MTPIDISPAEAAALVGRGAVLVDVRETSERADGIIPGATHAPLSELDLAELAGELDQPVIFHCRAGGRTRANAAALEAKAGTRQTYLLQGGIEGWRDAGLPIEQPN